jgi:hypothetical protein
MSTGEARQLSDDIRDAKRWLDEQWWRYRTLPDGDSYWDMSGVVPEKRNQYIEQKLLKLDQNDPDELEIL